MKRYYTEYSIFHKIIKQIKTKEEEGGDEDIIKSEPEDQGDWIIGLAYMVRLEAWTPL